MLDITMLNVVPSFFIVNIMFSNLRNFFFLFEETMESRNFDMFSQKDYALYSRIFWITDRNHLQIRLKYFSINEVFKN